MKRSQIAETAVTVTSLGFGAAPIGNLFRAIDDETARAAVVTAWDGGIRYFDTAPHYGLGLSERRLGAALAAYPRIEFTISTKVGRLLVPNDAPTGSDLKSGGFAVDDALRRQYDYSRDGVRRSLESSLDRLGTDHVEIVYVHDPEDHMEAAVLEAVPALVELREEGVIGAVGVGMNFVAPLRRFVSETDIDVIMVAGRWTLVDRSAELLLEDCLDRHVAVVSAAPFNSGLLSRPDPPDDAHFDYGPAPAHVLAAARACAAACATHGTTLPVAALQFPLLHPAVTSVVAGMRTAEQCALNLQWATTTINPHLWDALPTPDPQSERASRIGGGGGERRSLARGISANTDCEKDICVVLLRPAVAISSVSRALVPLRRSRTGRAARGTSREWFRYSAKSGRSLSSAGCMTVARSMGVISATPASTCFTVSSPGLKFRNTRSASRGRALSNADSCRLRSGWWTHVLLGPRHRAGQGGSPAA